MSSALKEAKDFLQANNYELGKLKVEAIESLDEADLIKLKKFCKNNKTKQMLYGARAIFQEAKNLIKNGQKTVKELRNDPKFAELEPQNWTSLQRLIYPMDQKSQGKIMVQPPQKMFVEDTSIGTHNRGTGLEQTTVNAYLFKFGTESDDNRQQILSSIVNRSVDTLIEFLLLFEEHNYQHKNGKTNLCILVNQLLIQNKNSLSSKARSRIFLYSLIHYRGERFQVEQELLHGAMTLLAESSELKQVVGLANFVFFNEVTEFTEDLQALRNLDQTNKNAIHLLKLAWTYFKVDEQVIQLIPNTLFSLNVPFIQVLKINKGLNLLQLPAIYHEYFICICALAKSIEFHILSNYMEYTKSVFQDYQEVIKKTNFQYFLEQLQLKLLKGDQYDLKRIHELQKQILECLIDKRMQISLKIFDQCILGDTTSLQQLCLAPKVLEEFPETFLFDTYKMFQSKNETNFAVKNFPMSFQVHEIVLQIQNCLKIRLHPLQLLCLNYFQQSKDNIFATFGIGNGKTLLCTITAIMKATLFQRSVFIVSKYEHLVQRDYKYFENLVQELNLFSNFCQCSYNKIGIFYFTMKEVSKQIKNKDFQKLWKSSFVVFDEFDSVIFDGSASNICETFKLLKEAYHVTGLSGSLLNNIEVKCLRQVFGGCATIIFPTLQQLCNDKRLKLDDKIFGKKDEYLSFIKNQVQQFVSAVPVVIVAENSAVQVLCKSLQNGKDLSIHNLTLLPPEKLEVQIQKNYLTKDLSNNYGVYILNEQLAVGSDIPTNSDIDRKGGSFLIIANIFSKRAEEQAKGRVGRFNNVCKWQRIVYNDDKNCTIEQYLSNIQDSLELKYEKKLAMLLKLIEDEDLEENQFLNPLFQTADIDEDNESSAEITHFRNLRKNLVTQSSQIHQESMKKNEKASKLLSKSCENYEIMQNEEIKDDNQKSLSLFEKKEKIDPQQQIDTFEQHSEGNDVFWSTACQNRASDSPFYQQDFYEKPDIFDFRRNKIISTTFLNKKSSSLLVNDARNARIIPKQSQKNTLNQEILVNVETQIENDSPNKIFTEDIPFIDDVIPKIQVDIIGQSILNTSQNAFQVGMISGHCSSLLIQSEYDRSTLREEFKQDRQLNLKNEISIGKHYIEVDIAQLEAEIIGDVVNIGNKNSQKTKKREEKFETKGSKLHQQDQQYEELKKRTRIKGKKVVDYDNLYFQSYEADEVHEEMLRDEV